MSVRSKDGKTWSTKLERIGELSAKDKDIVFNNLGHIIDVEMLKEMYQRLDGRKAVGIDKVTKKAYGEKLEENLVKLVKNIRRGSYQPRASRITEIPKEDGDTRPLAIACFEDKLVQLAASEILSKIHEPLFLECSYGFRPGRSCHDALKALMTSTYRNWEGAIVELDICKYFNTIPHKELNEMLQSKISDQRFLRLINILIKAPIVKDGIEIENTEGSPQGSIISPILANIYLHYVVDEWFEKTKQTHMRRGAEEVRYCDDMVFSFECYDDAERFYRVLSKRLNKYGLKVHPEKTRLIASGNLAAQKAAAKGKRLPTYQFLGFTCYWGRSRSGFWRLKYTSRQDRFTEKLKGLRKYLWSNLGTKYQEKVLKQVVRVVRGWINYHGVTDNHRRVRGFIEKSKRTLFRWINRRGRKNPIKWGKFEALLIRIKFPEKWITVSMFPAKPNT